MKDEGNGMTTLNPVIKKLIPGIEKQQKDVLIFIRNNTENNAFSRDHRNNGYFSMVWEQTFHKSTPRNQTARQSREIGTFSLSILGCAFFLSRFYKKTRFGAIFPSPPGRRWEFYDLDWRKGFP